MVAVPILMGIEGSDEQVEAFDPVNASACIPGRVALPDDGFA